MLRVTDFLDIFFLDPIFYLDQFIYHFNIILSLFKGAF